MLKFMFKGININDECYEFWGVVSDFDGMYVILDYYNYCIQVMSRISQKFLNCINVEVEFNLCLEV